MKIYGYLLLLSIFALALLIYEFIKAPLIDDSKEVRVKIFKIYYRAVREKLEVPYSNRRLVYELIRRCCDKDHLNAETSAELIKRYLAIHGRLRKEVN